VEARAPFIRLCPFENIQILSIQFFHLLGESAEICVCCNRVNLKGRIESAGQIVGAHCLHLAAPPSYALSVIPKDVHAFFSSQFPPLFGHPLSPHSMIKTMKQVCSSDHFFDRKFSFFNPYPNGLRGVRGGVPVALSMEARGRGRKQKKRARSLGITIRSSHVTWTMWTSEMSVCMHSQGTQEISSDSNSTFALLFEHVGLA